jgi:predicted nucleic acid-binding protein
VKRIADTGLLLAAVNAADPYHKWGAAQFRAHAPFHTCEAVLVELAYHLGNQVIPLQLVERGDVVVDFSIAEDSAPVLDLLTRYRSTDMSIADACLVRMTELRRLCKVWTVDVEDFSIYRRNRREQVPCVFPD